MADSKISQLTSAGTLDGTESVPIVQSSTTKKATAQAIADLAGTAFAKTLLDDTDEEAAMKTLLQDGRYGFFKFHDMYSSGSDGFYVTAISGTGAAFAGVASTSTEDGVQDFVMGTVSTNRVGWGSPVGAFLIGNGAAKHRSKLKVVQLSNGTDTYTLRVGFLTSYTGDPGNGAYFRYTDSVNGGRIEAVTRKSSIETAIDTGVSPDTANFQTFAIELDAAAGTATFKINDAQVAQTSSNVPGAVSMGSGVNVIRSAGTTTFNAVRLDYIKTFKKLTTPRT